MIGKIEKTRSITENELQEEFKMVQSKVGVRVLESVSECDRWLQGSRERVRECQSVTEDSKVPDKVSESARV